MRARRKISGRRAKGPSFLSRASKAFFSGAALVAVLVFAWPGVCRAQDRVHTVYFEGSDHELNVYRIHGKEKGKTLMLVGGIQGDEPGGFLSADLYADLTLARGGLIVVPRANFQSIVLKKRKVNEDMNRKFAGAQKGNYEAKIVGILKKLIAESDCLLNLHDGSGFFSEKWESPQRNPKRYGQSIIADTDVHHTDTGQTVFLGRMAREVARQINLRVKNPDHYFKFNNHNTRHRSTLHREQRKSATYYALYQCGIPAFGVETSKSLPLRLKVRHHNLAINAFMDVMGIVPETPGINLSDPELKYLVILVNGMLPVALKNNETLHVGKGDTIRVSHIEANYERGLSVDVLGHGALNDIKRDIKIRKPVHIIVRKDYSPCGRIDVAVSKKTKGVYVSSSPGEKPRRSLVFILRVNGEERTAGGGERLDLTRGDRLEIVDVEAQDIPSPDLTVNFKGFVGDKNVNRGEDRGYVIDTKKDLWKRYSWRKNGKTYRIVVHYHGADIGTLWVNLN
ncbi:conserved hypothetical protein [Candidatus Desulfarcum epimagneticum]|uniref:D,L-carboxypeptidase peptidase domain-containing protein n=1 Tax=uncultured Desulfobacteraceae bacterium TaxID=218296 RepID=A0A484HJR7_9BACT|nr:conserved hypothetical protein [uncultured Desulfobacteraceae bacterium]